MKGGNGPGQKCPLFPEIFTPTFTPNGLSRVGSKPPGVLGGAISGLLAPVKAGKWLWEHAAMFWRHFGQYLDTSIIPILGVNLGVNRVNLA